MTAFLIVVWDGPRAVLRVPVKIVKRRGREGHCIDIPGPVLGRAYTAFARLHGLRKTNIYALDVATDKQQQALEAAYQGQDSEFRSFHLYAFEKGGEHFQLVRPPQET